MAAHKPIYRSLYFQVIVAIIAGVLLDFSRRTPAKR